ncbi:MAG: branched-chain amino acid ABC transporter permease [Actinomycetota bacterium]
MSEQETAPAATTAPHRISRWSAPSTVGTSAFTLVFIVLALLPWWGSASTQFTLVEVLYYLALAQMWNLLAGYAGLVSVGQQAFVGIGAYAVFLLAERNGVDPWLAMVIAGAIAAALSVPVAFLTFKLVGGYFAIATWVIAEVIRLTVLEIDSIGAGNVQSFTVANTWSGYSLETRSDLIYWVALALAAGATVVAVLIARSRLGLALQAARDSAPGARGLGVNVMRTKLVVWVVAAGWTGMTGALIHLNTSTVTTDDAFSVTSWTALVIFIVVIGGVGSVRGPLIGVAIYWFISEQFEDSDTWRFIILGSAATLMALVSREGVDGLLQRIRPFEIFPIRRRLLLDGDGDADDEGTDAAR